MGERSLQQRNKNEKIKKWVKVKTKRKIKCSVGKK